MKGLSLLFLAALFSTRAFADTRDHKGLFGSYQRERYTENEAHSSDLGADILLSTLLPVSTYVTTLDAARSTTPMNYSTFFNVEASFFYTLGYRFEAFLNIGYYSFDTRKQNMGPNSPTTPWFEQFSITSDPVVLGVRYRLSTSDIVPYFGVGLGASYVVRQASFDYNPLQQNQYDVVGVGQVIAGLEFFISSHAGIRMEASAYYMPLPAVTYAPDPSLTSTYPTFYMQPDLWSVRYASGIFFLF